jgi:membrane dipeptidase
VRRCDKRAPSGGNQAIATPSQVATGTDPLRPVGIEDMPDHIDYIAKRIGVDRVGIGNVVEQGGGIEGFGDSSGELIVTRRLLRRGDGAEDIDNIRGGKHRRVLRAAAK